MSTLDLTVVMNDSDKFGYRKHNPSRSLDLTIYSNQKKAGV
jgi:hypothetical protein